MICGLALAVSACERRPEAPAPPAVPVETPPPAPIAEGATKPSKTLAAVRSRGYLRCGVHEGLAGFAFRDNRGEWRGFDVDICRAVAAAVLGDAGKVRFTSLSAQDRFGTLEGGQIDLLSRNTSWTYSRDAGRPIDFAAITYYDGQGFLVRRALGLTSAAELSGARICVQAGTAAEASLAEYFQARGLNYRAVVAGSEAEARNFYQTEQCDAFTADVGALASARSVMNNPGNHVILPEIISKEPLGPVVREDDAVWTDIVRWTVWSLVLAEELKLSGRSLPLLAETTTNPETRRLLGLDEADYGRSLGLSKDWAYQAILQVGAYDEIFERNLGAGSPLRLERGLNALWNAPRPGLLYAPPMR
ncbi:MAG: amino acid ABC transporter substrate-binding protein [Phenylobacterium sp.]|uniref:amino acid ABC transporter substrate-binding protein n=1 Tax=Phenylobacterium sp. TaxID=1871053 RepID=UPI00391C4E1D